MQQEQIGSDEVLARARRLADEVLFPNALQTDSADLVPSHLLDELAAAGMYGLLGPVEAGGLAASAAEADASVEILAGGCLTTTFVCMQHHGVVAAVAAAEQAIQEEWLRRLCAGEVRSGVAFAGLRRPGPPVMRVREADGGYLLDGHAPWVTGWGRIDLVHVAARDERGDVSWLLVDAVRSESLTIEPLRLAAVNASATVTLHLDAHFVPAERLTRREGFDEWRMRDAAGLRRNGSLALGIASRAVSLLDEELELRPALISRIAAARQALDDATQELLPKARAEASALAADAARALVIAGGGKSVRSDEHAQRLAREAMFLLVFGQTPAIRSVQLELGQLESGQGGGV